MLAPEKLVETLKWKKSTDITVMLLIGRPSVRMDPI
jgi:hypothetical protein